MNKRLLVRYVRLALAEADTARVPNQLMSPDGLGVLDAGDDDLEEFSGAGAVAGYSAPLGTDPDRLGRRKNAGKR